MSCENWQKTTTLLVICFALLPGCSSSRPDNDNAVTGSPVTGSPVTDDTVPTGGQDEIAEASRTGAPQPPDSSTLAARRNSHERMLAELRGLRDRMSDENQYLGDRKLRLMRAALENLATENKSPSVQQWRLLNSLGHSELRLGNEREALRLFGRAYSVGKQLAGKMPTGSARETMFSLSVGFMRLGETENCCVQNTPESCLFPIRPSAVHVNQEGSRQAIRALEQLLAVSEPQTVNYKESQWLLNIAYMTLGEYPHKVPSKFLIGPEAFRSEDDFASFPNVAADVGLNTFSTSGGAIAEDFDADGRLDVLVSTWEQAGQLRLFRNTGTGKFVDVTEQAGLTGLFGGLNMIQGDFNNDGHVDVYVLRGAWLGKQGQHVNSLLRNNGDGTFTDITYLAGLGDHNFPTQTAAWADYDLDGDLDLYIGNEPLAKVGSQLTDDVVTSSQLFRNNGDETFTDIAATSGVTNQRAAKAVVWGDYNQDRWPDLYVSNYGDENRLYRNNGDGTFTDVAVDLEVTGPNKSFPAWFWDYDNDGRLDIFVSAYAAHTHDLLDFFLDRPVGAETARLYRGTDSGFIDTAQSANLRQPTLPMGSNFGDLNNDGYLDFYLGTGDPHYQQLMPNVMYLNKAGERFVDVTTAGGFGNLQKGHAVVFADFDNDGDQDVFEQMGGAFLGDRYYDALYQNPGSGNRWISIELVGVESNRSAIGSRIKIEIEDAGQQRSIYKHVNSGGSFGGNPLRQIIGLGRATDIARLEIYWPRTDATQVFDNVPVNSRIRVVEGRSHLGKLE